MPTPASGGTFNPTEVIATLEGHAFTGTSPGEAFYRAEDHQCFKDILVVRGKRPSERENDHDFLAIVNSVERPSAITSQTLPWRSRRLRAFGKDWVLLKFLLAEAGDLRGRPSRLLLLFVKSLVANRLVVALLPKPWAEPFGSTGVRLLSCCRAWPAGERGETGFPSPYALTALFCFVLR